MEILVALLVAAVVGIIVKLVLGVFDVTRPYADVIALLVAVIVFIDRIGWV
jgi:hypothetical protein